MKSKILGLLSLSILSLVIVMSFASAGVLTITNTSVIPSTADAGQVITINFNLTHDGSTDGNYSLNWSDSSSTFTTLPTLTQINISEIKSDSAVLTIPSDATGTFTSSLNVTGTDTGTAKASLPITITINEPTPEPVSCNGTTARSLDLTIEEINVVEGYGDEDEWLLLDEIEVEINVENNNNDEKIKDVTIEWGLYDNGANEWVIDMDDESDFDIKSDDDKTIIVTFKINEKTLEVDFDELDGDYTLYVKATGEEQGDTDYDVCDLQSESVSIEIESDFVVVNDIEMIDTVSCGTDLQITADVYNIGDDDQEEVMVYIVNNDLGISQKVEIGDIDAFKDEKLDITIEIPEDAEAKSYEISFIVYDEDNDIYENDYDDDESKASVMITVEGSCSSEPTAVVSANLESGGKAGEDLVVKATITNTGDESATYSVNAAGYTEWASAAELDSSVVVIGAGESKDVSITFSVNKDASGDQAFTLEAVSDGEVVIQQPVAVTIEAKSGFSLTGNSINGDNWHLWGIGALNIILVIIIIVVAMRVARSS